MSRLESKSTLQTVREREGQRDGGCMEGETEGRRGRDGGKEGVCGEKGAN